jgi:hypothetical protein
MPSFQAQIYKINDVIGWHERRELQLAPGFQRRRVWTLRGKSFLIDSILRGMPLPQFFIREIVLPREKRTVREVVDGQQRLSAILGYIAGDFTVLPMHNAEFARRTFEELPEETQKKFLFYPLSVNVLEGTEDADVLEIFSRINSYSEPLNAQEKLNALYVGAFKSAMVELARDHLNFWRRHHILSEQAVARMKDMELASELVGVMLFGLESGKKRVGQMFKVYDDAFPQFEYIRPRFGECLQLCERLVGGDLSPTIFSRSTLFYSLYAAVYSCRYGFGAGPDAHAHVLVEDQLPVVQDGLVRLSQAIEADVREEEIAEFYLASRQSTDKLPQRTTRHVVLTQIITPAFGG